MTIVTGTKYGTVYAFMTTTLEFDAIFIKYSWQIAIGHYENKMTNVRSVRLPFEHLMKSGSDGICYRD